MIFNNREVIFILSGLNKFNNPEEQLKNYLDKFYKLWHNDERIKNFLNLIKDNNSFYNIKISLYYSKLLKKPKGIILTAEGNSQYDNLFELTAVLIEDYLRKEGLEYVILAPGERFISGFDDLNYMLDEIYCELLEDNSNEVKRVAEEEIRNILRKINYIFKNIKIFDDKIIEIIKKHKLKLKKEEELKINNEEELTKNIRIKFFDSAAGYYNLGMYEEAIKELEKLLVIDKYNIKALLNIGWIYLQKDEIEKAEKYFKKVYKLDKENPVLLNGMGVIFLKKKEIKKAKKYFIKSIEIDDKSDNAYFAFNSLGEILVKEHSIKDAVTNFEKAVLINKNKIDAHINLALLYHYLGIYNESDKEFDYCLSLNPNNKKLKIYKKLNLAQREMIKGNYEEAEKIYKQIIKLKPKDADIYNRFGNFLFKINKIKRAIAMYKIALKYDEKNDKVLYNLGIAYLKINELEKSKRFFNKVLELCPEDKYTLNQLGWIEYKKNEYNNAIDYFLKALKKDSNFILPLLNLGWVYIQQNELTKALQIYQNLLIKYPDNLIIRNDLGIVYFKLKLFEKANSEFQFILNYTDNVKLKATALYYLGLISKERGNKEKAISYFKEVLKYENNHLNSLKELLSLVGTGGDEKLIKELKNKYEEILRENNNMELIKII
ncbi:MAG TPA: tetratricopeptide repeat protein [bacterium]|nr:tetratricopeptide repeat protein [bacterium]HOL48346.1 tetratricopeptide repeat protein [bacterium]HPQ19836.1 tetratricopeptide repeat protein [bacterium]